MRFLSLIAFIFMAFSAHAGDALSPEDITAQARIIKEQIKNLDLDEFLPSRQLEATPEQRVVAAEILSTSQQFVERAMAEEGKKMDLENLLVPDAPNTTITVFITLGEAPSYSQGKELLGALVGVKGNILVALRGLPDGVRQIDKATNLIKAITGKDFSELPPIDLDPVKFKKYAITRSPTLVYERDGEEVARVSGQLAHSYLRRQVEEESFTGDLGVFGSTSDIVERDLIEEIKDRMSKIDWIAKREKAAKRFWKKQKIQKLPAAAEDRTFSVKPEFEFNQNIYDHKGNVVVEKGETLNILTETLKINQTRFYLIIFDGSDAAQVEKAKDLAANAPKNHKTILITTTLADLDNGWDALPSLEDQFKAAVFLLDERFVHTFGLQYVPCTVRPTDTEYIIQEYRREL